MWRLNYAGDVMIVWVGGNLFMAFLCWIDKKGPQRLARKVAKHIVRHSQIRKGLSR